MENVRIAIIDTGISPNAECANRILESYILNCEKDNYTLLPTKTEDHIGHGTAVASIIYSLNQKIEIVSINICKYNYEVEECALIYALEYLYQKCDVDIINISAGITNISDNQGMKDICDKLNARGIIIISAYDNNKAISYPAAYKSVIGIDVISDYDNKHDIYRVENSIVNILVPDVYYRTLWLNEKAIIKGTSFAAAKITGLISKKIHNLWKNEYRKISKKNIIEAVTNKLITLPIKDEVPQPNFCIKKAIVFPLNKESRALLHYRNRLQFEIVGVYDARMSINIHKNVLGEYIRSYNEIDWRSDFDTVIISCTDELYRLAKRDYYSEILKMAQKYHKNIYSFEKSNANASNYFYPEITKRMVPYENFKKLHKINIPIVGVYGTSSKQGKYTLQLELIYRLSTLGYNVGHIASEPSGYLFNSDFVFHFGYHSYVNLHPRECISILNQMVWEIQEKRRDILIAGCQSNTVHYDNCQIDDFAIYQNAFLLGTLPDFIILCVNPHDDIEYIERTIRYINAIDVGKVGALVIFPIQAIETITGISYKLENVSKRKMQELQKYFGEIFKMPAFALGEDEDMKQLCELIITFFSEE